MSDDPLPEFVGVTREVFAALSSEIRLRILCYVADADTEVRVTDIATGLELGQSTVSQGLTRLRRAELVSRRRDGRNRYYATTVLADRLLAVTADELR